MPKLPLTRHLVALGAGACLFFGLAASAAQASTVGILPPHNPSSNCSAGGDVGLAGINTCRARENVGPLRLPSNWGSLSPAEQGFVLIDLERVNRGMAPIVGLSSSLNAFASAGAHAGADPSFPSGGFSGGAIWAGAPTVFAADEMWMYLDGPGGNNLDCTSAGGPGCWGHRQIILWNRTGGRLVAGGGYASSGGTSSYAYVVLAGYSAANLTFTWADELKYFAIKPGVEPLGKAAAAERRHKKRPRRHHHRAQPVAPAPSADSGPTITFS